MGMLCRKEDNKTESVSGNEQTRIPQTDQVRDTQSSSKSQVTNLMSSVNTKGFEWTKPTPRPWAAKWLKVKERRSLSRRQDSGICTLKRQLPFQHPSLKSGGKRMASWHWREELPNGMAGNWNVSQEWGQRRWGKTKDNVNLPLETTLKDWEDGSVGKSDCSVNTRTCVLIHNTYIKCWTWLHISEHQHWESRKGGHPVQWDAGLWLWPLHVHTQEHILTYAPEYNTRTHPPLLTPQHERHTHCTDGKIVACPPVFSVDSIENWEMIK